MENNILKYQNRWPLQFQWWEKAILTQWFVQVVEISLVSNKDILLLAVYTASKTLSVKANVTIWDMTILHIIKQNPWFIVMVKCYWPLWFKEINKHSMEFSLQCKLYKHFSQRVRSNMLNSKVVTVTIVCALTGRVSTVNQIFSSTTVTFG